MLTSGRPSTAKAEYSSAAAGWRRRSVPSPPLRTWSSSGFGPGCQPPLPGHSTSRYRQDKELTAASKIAPRCPPPLIRKEHRSTQPPTSEGSQPKHVGDTQRPGAADRRVGQGAKSTAYSGVTLVAAMSTTIRRIGRNPAMQCTPSVVLPTAHRRCTDHRPPAGRTQHTQSFSIWAPPPTQSATSAGS